MNYTTATPLKGKYSWSVKFAPWESKSVNMELYFLENRNKWQRTLEDCKRRRVALPDAAFHFYEDEKELEKMAKRYNPKLSKAKREQLACHLGAELTELIQYQLNLPKVAEEKAIEGEPPLKYLRILKDPQIFYKITGVGGELDKQIVGEVESRQTIFLCAAGGRLVENAKLTSFNIIVNDESGVGKDYVCQKTLEAIPKACWIKKTRISENVLTYWHNSRFEPDWTWDGKVFYIEDISNSVLNCDVLKVFSSSGTSATVLIKQVPVEVEVKGKPGQIVTTAKSTPNEENLRRYALLGLNSGVEQTKGVIRRRAKFAEDGVTPEYNQDFIEAQAYLKRVKVRVLFASMIAEYFCQRPELEVIMRTQIDRFLDFIKASAAFHQYQRLMEDGYLLATKEDYEIARIAILKVTSNPFMVPLTKDQQKILSIFKAMPPQETLAEGTNYYSVADLEEHIDFLSDKWLRVQLDFLSSKNFLIKGGKEGEKGKKVIAYTLKEFSAYTFPNWEEMQKFYNSYNTTNNTTTTNTTKQGQSSALRGGSCSNCSDCTLYSHSKFKVLKEIPAFVGSDKKTYGSYKKGDLAELPEKVAQLLIKKGIVEEVSENG